jgi:putative ATPase
VPQHLRDRHYAGATRLGHGDNYQYPHNTPEGWIDQEYLGVDRTYYEPTPRGFEVELAKRLEDLRQRRQKAE